MKLNKLLQRAAVMAVFMTVSFALATSSAMAFSSNADSAQFQPGSYVFDDFTNLFFRPDQRAYWFTENIGYFNGSELRTRETECALQTCVHVLHEDDTKFLRLEVHAHPYSNVFTLANLSEIIDGQGTLPGDTGTVPNPGPWNPTVGHPIVVETRMRFSPNMNSDGSGGGTGSAGIWLWDAPYSQGNPNATQNGFGFSWAYNGSLVQGMAASVIRFTYPVYFHPVQVNMSDWNVYKYVWSVDASGNQNVDFYINGTQVGSSPVLFGSLKDLSLEVWLDNQQFSFTGINRVPVPQDDYMDMDYVLIQKN